MPSPTSSRNARVEDEVERRVNEKMVHRHAEYVRDLKIEALREAAGPETAATQRRLDDLVALDERRLNSNALDALRPKTLAGIVGQEAAIAALLAKLASPFPQHVILYGPPGVGKTTVARLALELAKRRAHTPFAANAPFVEASGTTLRWDYRETTNPLLGSVHDPIYQGSRRDLAESGIPEPKLGLVTKAHGGVLFIDEIGEMAPPLQTKLLKVLEDKRVMFESSYYDEHDPNVPAYVKKLFADGAPADFILIGATTPRTRCDRSGDSLALRGGVFRAAHASADPAHRARGGEAAQRAHDEDRAAADRDLHQ